MEGGALKYILDTNIIIYALKNSYSSIAEHFLRIPAQSIMIPTTVVAAIEYGARKSVDYEKTIAKYRKFMSAFEKADFSEKASYHCGEIRAFLEKRGCIIGTMDLMIAATALAENAILVTHNTKEFKRIPGLVVEDWTIVSE